MIIDSVVFNTIPASKSRDVAANYCQGVGEGIHSISHTFQHHLSR